MESPYSHNPFSAVYAPKKVRAAFFRQAYLGFALLLLLWIAVECWLIQLPISRTLYHLWFDSNTGWMGVLAGFLILRFITRQVSNRGLHWSLQFLSLAACLILQSILFLPILLHGQHMTGSPFLKEASILAGSLFLGIVATAISIRRDFNKYLALSQILLWLGAGLLACAFIWGFKEGWFILLSLTAIASFAVFHETLRILKYQDTDEVFGASLNLFASLSLLLWVSLRFVIIRIR